MKNIWYDSEDYFYGKIKCIGGGGSPYIGLDTEEYGLLHIQYTQKIVSTLDPTLLDQEKLIYASCKLKWTNREMDKNSLKFISFYEYTPDPDWEEFNKSMDLITKDLEEKYPLKEGKMRDPVKRLRYIRGYDD